ncbi:YopX family protein [Enterococcus sp. AZ109]|uniref:YopX family protein n=1 Tax=Enterococcus sp. AZ109 TaxID=2774634 RepID=UPI003F21077A
MIPKFRAWDKKDKIMRAVNTINFSTCTIICDPIRGHDDMLELYDPVCFKGTYELMQSTGLKDKNGRDVFQGDIVTCTSGCQHEVIWLKEYGGKYFGGMPAWYLSGLTEGYAWTSSEEVIGNIYENPELLEVAE